MSSRLRCCGFKLISYETEWCAWNLKRKRLGYFYSFTKSEKDKDYGIRRDESWRECSKQSPKMAEDAGRVFTMERLDENVCIELYNPLNL